MIMAFACQGERAPRADVQGAMERLYVEGQGVVWVCNDYDTLLHHVSRARERLEALRDLMGRHIMWLEMFEDFGLSFCLPMKSETLRTIKMAYAIDFVSGDCRREAEDQYRNDLLKAEVDGSLVIRFVCIRRTLDSIRGAARHIRRIHHALVQGRREELAAVCERPSAGEEGAL